MMNSKPGKSTMRLWLLLLSGILVSACGGGAGSSQSAGIGGTGIVARGYVQGEVTGFGSVFVNGVEFDTDSSEFLVDGDASVGQEALAVGMVVTLEVETEDGSYTGKALQVVYDDEIEGPIDSTVGISTSPDGTKKTFEVFGQTITIDDTATRFSGTNFNDIVVDDLVEISGFRISLNEVRATYVKYTGHLDPGVSKVELRGRIENYDSGPPETFELGGILIEVDRADPGFELDVPGGILQNGLFVEVKGIYEDATTITATGIELEDESLGEDVDDVRLQGIISNFVDSSNFEISGQRVNAQNASPPGVSLGNGIEVEVEGNIVNGVLIADELKVEEYEPELRSFISAVDIPNNRFEVSYPVASAPFTVVVSVNAQTVFEDETGPIVTSPFSIDDLVPGVGRSGDYVRVEGQKVGNEIVANVVKRVDPDNSRSIEGVVEAYTPDSFITVLGVTFQLALGVTQYDPDPADIDIGKFVGIEDKDELADPADGVADEVEIEN